MVPNAEGASLLAVDQPLAPSPISVRALVIGALAGAIVVGLAWAVVTVSHPSDATIASMAGESIHQSTLNKTLDNQYGLQTVQQMIDSRLIEAGAKAAHLSASPRDLSQALGQIEAAYGITSSAALTAFLQQNGLTQTQFNGILKDQVLEQKLSEQGVSVTSQEIKDYYAAHKTTFTLSGQKTEQPLSQVKGQIVAALKRSKAESSSSVLAALAKKFNLQVPDKTYQSIETSIEHPSAPVSSIP